ncbi:MAG: acireductone synthase [Parvibaculum sp.]|uniref:acireductone synthase n=1 Tax=Parvibaculum sp. TaxID=2024848 RepID=UPI002ABC57CF|nr:acireductone synthase [Parvibaculum sp.]MDZ4379921.1 acireductone synthase [Parvibaculum sp.]
MSEVRAIVTDIEGTTTPIAFVHQVLFPYARERLAAFVAAHGGEAEVVRTLAEARVLGGIPEASTDETVALLLSWIDEDRKAGPLKFLQGLIWRQGYEAGVLKGPVYADAAAMLRRWHERGLRLFVYSSGSEEAQKLIFGYSDQGDLTPLFEGFFDTRIGGKLEASSYEAIARAAQMPADAMLFLSDHAGEIAAARAAGMQAVLIDRATPPELWHDEAGALVAGSFEAAERACMATAPRR